MKRTQVIAGQEVTLEVGKTYLAMGNPSTNEVEIREKSTNVVAHRFTARGRASQNTFLGEFNNGASSFAGRVWQ